MNKTDLYVIGDLFHLVRYTYVSEILKKIKHQNEFIIDGCVCYNFYGQDSSKYVYLTADDEELKKNDPSKFREKYKYLFAVPMSLYRKELNFCNVEYRNLYSLKGLVKEISLSNLVKN